MPLAVVSEKLRVVSSVAVDSAIRVRVFVLVGVVPGIHAHADAVKPGVACCLLLGDATAVVNYMLGFSCS